MAFDSSIYKWHSSFLQFSDIKHLNVNVLVEVYSQHGENYNLTTIERRVDGALLRQLLYS